MSQAESATAENQEWAQEEPEKHDQWAEGQWGAIPPEEEEEEQQAVQTRPTPQEKQEEEDEEDGVPHTGVCRWFSNEKGFGFIAMDGAKNLGDVWVHKSAILKVDGEMVTLNKGQKCEFQLSKRKKKNNYQALKVIPGEMPVKKPLPPPKKAKGVCHWFSESLGYGFISPDEGEEDIFVHGDTVKDGKVLKDGQKVEFEVVTDKNKRLRAINVIAGELPPQEEQEDPIDKQTPIDGICVRWVEDRGFGFIKPAGSPADVDDQLLVHFNNILKPDEDRPSLTKGQLVTFKKIKRKGRRDGYEAVQVIPGEVPEEESYKGVCKWFNPTKGFGFISRDKFKGNDYHVHISNIVPPEEEDDGSPILSEGQRVEFSIQMGPNGKMRAIKVVPGEKPLPGQKRAKSRMVIDFEPYLPIHLVDESGGSDSSPTPKRTALTPQEIADNLRKEKNWKKKQRKLRKKREEKEGGAAAGDAGGRGKENNSRANNEGGPSSNSNKQQKKQKKKKQQQKNVGKKASVDDGGAKAKKGGKQKSSPAPSQPVAKPIEEPAAPVMTQRKKKKPKNKASSKSRVQRKNTDNAIQHAVEQQFAANVKDNAASASPSSYFGSILAYFRRWCFRS